jgi:putative mRNA 3-end processing factor
MHYLAFMTDVLTFTDRGIYCPAGDFYIDPWRPVPRALITHAHSDHARAGMAQYLASTGTAPVLRYRLGAISLQTIRYGDIQQIGDAQVSFHPAGHVPGSAQIKVSVGGQVWVVSGDYKTQACGLSEAFEPQRCHAFITESTFGLPLFRWPTQDALAAQINQWWADCADRGQTAVLGAYALGKAQRVLRLLDPSIGPVLTHSAIENTNDVLRAQGIALPATIRLDAQTSAKTHPRALVLTTPGQMDGGWSKRFGPRSTGFASGWMALRGVRRRRGGDLGFALSDHADWAGLNSAIAATGAQRIFVTHGYVAPFQRWLAQAGYDAHIVSTDYNGDDAP